MKSKFCIRRSSLQEVVRDFMTESNLSPTIMVMQLKALGCWLGRDKGIYSLSEDDPTPTSTRETRPTTRHDPKTKVRGKCRVMCGQASISALFFSETMTKILQNIPLSPVPLPPFRPLPRPPVCVEFAVSGGEGLCITAVAVERSCKNFDLVADGNTISRRKALDSRRGSPISVRMRWG